MCFLQMLEALTRQIRGLDAPWGGLQLILSGDFFQLPPISSAPRQGMAPDTFLNRGLTFQCPAWSRSNLEVGSLNTPGPAWLQFCCQGRSMDPSCPGLHQTTTSPHKHICPACRKWC